MSDENDKTDMDDIKSTSSNPDTPISCFCCNKSSCRRLWHSYNSYWQLLSVSVVVSVYVVIGGVIFSSVERPEELRRIEESEVIRNYAIANFTQLLLNSTNLTEEEAMNLTESFLELGQAAVEASDNQLFSEHPLWDLSSAIFFCATTITTIGYGNLAPSTAAGQILFIFYAAIGIPVALLFLALIGSIIKAWVDRILKPVERRWGSAVSRAIGSLLLLSAVVIFFVLIPAAVFTNLEDWSYREGVYFTVVTLTTVGFGDYVPAQTVNAPDNIAALYTIISSIWLWIGLALVAALLSEAQSTIKYIGVQCHTNPCCGAAKKIKQDVVERREKRKIDSSPNDVTPVN